MSDELRLTRRSALLGGAAVAAGAALGAGVTVGVEQLMGSPGPSPAATLSADADLMEEHGLLKRILLVYRYSTAQLQAGATVPAAAVHDAATVVHDFIEGFHEGLEEGYVFPRLQRAGVLVPTVETLLTQHARGRRITQAVLAATGSTGPLSASSSPGLAERLALFVRMYEPHEAREDTVVYPAWRGLLSPSEREGYATMFAMDQTQQFGSGAFAGMVARVASIEEELGLYDLAQFTPPETAD